MLTAACNNDHLTPC